MSPLSMVLEKILTPLIKTTRSFLLDTNDFIQVIRSLGPISPSSLLITWDVNSLYTSIVHEKGLAATDRLLSDNKEDIKIRHFCADLLGLVLKENYFMFQETFYAQQQGTAMGANVAFENDFVAMTWLVPALCLNVSAEDAEDGAAPEQSQVNIESAGGLSNESNSKWGKCLYGASYGVITFVQHYMGKYLIKSFSKQKLTLTRDSTDFGLRLRIPLPTLHP
ncbi:unnamed protein product [Ranitomeya imitator]|uniref:Uncharacterized protein n=1 Tax=Ranitomeya imitator TaxID=111125 RepID=A0ABN9M0F3_9NEOB|nr:unnamed protein product [Ranitomeya imitator]